MFEKTRAYDLEWTVAVADRAIGASLKRYGEFARPELDFLVEHATQDTGSLLDVGANIGVIALPFAKARPGWTVDAVEAHRGICALLAQNAAGNELENVRAIHAVAGAEARMADFPSVSLDTPGNHGTLRVDQVMGSREHVEMVRLDDVARSDVRLVKIDVEGYEAQVLAGAERLVRSRRAIWVVEASSHFPAVVASVADTFRGHGYTLRWLWAPFATPLSAKGAPKNPLVGDNNFVAFPDPAADRWGLPEVNVGEELSQPDAARLTYLARYGYGAAA